MKKHLQYLWAIWWWVNEPLKVPSGYVKIDIENGHRNSEFSHEKMWFSIVMLVYQRVMFHMTRKKMIEILGDGCMNYWTYTGWLVSIGGYTNRFIILEYVGIEDWPWIDSDYSHPSKNHQYLQSTQPKTVEPSSSTGCSFSVYHGGRDGGLPKPKNCHVLPGCLASFSQNHSASIVDFSYIQTHKKRWWIFSMHKVFLRDFSDVFKPPKHDFFSPFFMVIIKVTSGDIPHKSTQLSNCPRAPTCFAKIPSNHRQIKVWKSFAMVW